MALPSIAKLSIDDLMTLRETINKRLVSERALLEKQISRIGDGDVVGRALVTDRRKLKGSKVAPKYRSKQDRSLTWTGRGNTPRWMTAEMKARKLKKDAFLIK